MTSRLLPYDRLVVRWTIGDVRERGFEMLRLSISCAFRLLRSRTKYLVCVNSLPAGKAKELTGIVTAPVEWREVTWTDLPERLRPDLDDGFAEGVAWKLTPLRTYPDRYELALDNDCILCSCRMASCGRIHSEVVRQALIRRPEHMLIVEAAVFLLFVVLPATTPHPPMT